MEIFTHLEYFLLISNSFFGCLRLVTAAMALKMRQLPNLIVFFPEHTLQVCIFTGLQFFHFECFIFVDQQHGDEKVEMNDIVALPHFDSIQWLE